ncbi:DUF5723 family protein [Spirosoma radiotolerans]|uniref:DUF5723 domain-containing protein n=1 Tax=Spirosoma radiotolerans TaxID=1379870 RepID=A0A0E3ZVF2_9BACT|nr:DUF5723 family protein [Spirosoma radiotolerans]AKD55070.1 hypothetical protein SD10_09275 [Spirosoma radiotolerans]
MRYSFALLSTLLISITSFSQNLLGISTSRYGGTNRLYINPALAADSPSKFYLNVFTGNGHVDNNYVRYQAPFSLLRLITGTVPPQYKSADGSIKFSSDYTREMLNGRAKNGTIWGEVRGPAFLIKTGQSSAFAVTTRFRAVGQVVGASESLLSALRASLSDGAFYSVPSNDNKFSANTNTYAELGLTYAGAILEGDGRKLLLGATAKFLLGYNAQQLINRGLNYRIVTDPNNSSSALLEVNKLDATLAYTTFLENRSLNPQTLFNTAAPGKGLGLDVGLTYVDQYDEDSPALQIGVAVTDIGGLTYTGPKYNYNDLGASPAQFRGSDFNQISGPQGIAQVIQNRLNTGRTPDSQRFNAGLPTSLNLSADYQLPGGLGINVTYLQDLRSMQATAIHQPSLFAVTPRYDARWLSLAAPIAYLNGGLTAGASVRVGPGWLGSDNLLGLLGSSSNSIKPRGLDLYLGIAFGIGRANDERYDR